MPTSYEPTARIASRRYRTVGWISGFVQISRRISSWVVG
jgi:hypothetical protein